MFKKVLSIVLCICLLFGFTCIANAEKTDAGKILLRSRIIVPDELKKQNLIQIDSPTYEYGTIKIDDLLDSESGWIQEADQSFADTDSFKTAVIKIVSWVPGVGQYLEKGLTLLNDLSSLFSDLDTINRSRTIFVQTSHSYRNFYHYIYAYDYTNLWKQVGGSVSRYYYKHEYMRYFSNGYGEYRTATYDFTYGNGYQPCVMAKAPNYMKYDVLSRYGYESWIYNRFYRESY